MEAENILVLAWPEYSSDMSPIDVWDALDRRIQQRVPVPANIQQLRTASTLCEGDVWHSVRQMVVTTDTDWFSDTHGSPQYSKTAHFIVASYCGQPNAHLCNNHAV